MPKKIRYPLIHELFNNVYGHVYKIDELIYKPQEIANSIFYVNKGAVRIFTLEGKSEVVKRIVIPNELFGMEGLFQEEIHLDSAASLKSNCVVKALPVEAFKSKLEKEKTLLDEFFHLLRNRQRAIDKRLISTTFKSSEQIVIEYLEELAQRSGIQIGVEVLVPVMLQHKDIANLLGVSRQTVSGILSDLRKRNLIYYNRNKLLIRDFEGKIQKHL